MVDISRMKEDTGSSRYVSNFEGYGDNGTAKEPSALCPLTEVFSVRDARDLLLIIAPRKL
jgi:hypothetical protein